MSRRSYLQSLISNLKELNGPRSRTYLPKKEAYEQLKYHTGQDFGDDVDAWENWVNNHPHTIHKSEKSNESSPLLKMHRKLIEED